MRRVPEPDHEELSALRATRRKRNGHERAIGRARRDPSYAEQALEKMERQRQRINEQAKRIQMLERVIADAGIALILPAGTGAAYYDVDADAQEA